MKSAAPILRARSSRARTFGSMSAPRRSSRSRCIAKASGCTTPPWLLTAACRRTRIVSLDSRAPAFSSARWPREAAATVRRAPPAAHPARYQCGARPTATARAAETPRRPSRHRAFAQSATLRHRTDGIERRLKGNAPSVGMRCRLGLKPTRPQSAAGMRTEPPVSLPMAISHMPSATATAAPEDEPPGMRARSCGIARRAVMRIGAHRAEKANSVMLVLATITAPPARNARTIGASAEPAWPRRRALSNPRASPRRQRRTDP